MGYHICIMRQGHVRDGPHKIEFSHLSEPSIYAKLQGAELLKKVGNEHYPSMTGFRRFITLIG